MPLAKQYAILILGVVIGLGSGWIFGFQRGQDFVYEQEFKVTSGNLRVMESEIQGHEGLFEYLKMRSYYFAGFVPEDWYGSDLDHGKVDPKRLPSPGMSPGKGPSNNDSNYEAIRKVLK